MEILEKLIAGFVERSCKNYITTIIGVLSMIVFGVNTFGSAIPVEWYTAVNMATVILAGVALILAKDSGQSTAGIPVVKTLGVFLLLLLLPVTVHAQTATTVTQLMTPTTDIQDLYAAGASYSVNASPGIAGTGLYAHLIAGSGTYAFTAVDALPNTIKPFTVTSNIGVGVAQKLTSFGKIGIYVPTAAGISWSGTNTGWQWNGGAAAVIPLKNNYVLMPTIRFLKSSVSGGTGYQPIIGILFGWGK